MNSLDLATRARNSSNWEIDQDKIGAAIVCAKPEGDQLISRVFSAANQIFLGKPKLTTCAEQAALNAMSMTQVSERGKPTKIVIVSQNGDIGPCSDCLERIQSIVRREGVREEEFEIYTYNAEGVETKRESLHGLIHRSNTPSAPPRNIYRIATLPSDASTTTQGPTSTSRPPVQYHDMPPQPSSSSSTDPTKRSHRATIHYGTLPRKSTE